MKDCALNLPLTPKFLVFPPQLLQPQTQVAVTECLHTLFSRKALCIYYFFPPKLFFCTVYVPGKVPAPIPATVAVGAPTAARVLLKQRSEDPSIGRSSASTGLATGSPTSPSEDASVVGRGGDAARGEAEDDHSDKGTYTIELEKRNPEEEEARRMIDKVGVIVENKQTKKSS